MTILVTGATGFVGRALVPHLAARWPVRAMARVPERAPDSWDVVQGDLLDPDSLARACAGIDCVVHLAAVADSSDERLNHRVNVDGTAALGQACVEAGVGRVINFSSTCAGRDLRDAYGESKRLAERELDRDGLRVTHLRPAMIYGPGSKEWDLFVEVIRRSPVVPIPGTGRSILRPVHRDDVLDLVARVIERDAAALGTYDVAGPVPVTTTELVEAVGRALGLKRRVIPLPAGPVVLGARILGRLMERPFVNVDQVMAFLQDTVVDIEPARRDLGFDPRPLVEGLDDVLEGLR